MCAQDTEGVVADPVRFGGSRVSQNRLPRRACLPRVPQDVDELPRPTESEGEGRGWAFWGEETKEEHEHRHGDGINSPQPRKCE